MSSSTSSSSSSSSSSTLFSSPASSSSSGSSIHPSSLVSPSCHSPAMLHLISLPVSSHLVNHLVAQIADTVDYALGRVTSPRSRNTRNARSKESLDKFTTFVTNVLTRAEVSTQTVLGTLVYIDRARSHLQIALEEWALERVFLGSLIVASKYLNDSTLKNVHWAMCTGVFGKRDIGRIEREFLDVLDFELGITEADVLAHHEALVESSVDTPMTATEEVPRNWYSYPRRAPVAPTSAAQPQQQQRRESHAQSTSIPQSQAQPSLHYVPIPQFSPSAAASPSSSSSSSSSASSSPLSPHTPTTPLDMPMDIDPKRPSHVQSHSGRSIHDLLRSFPSIPVQSQRHHQRSYQQPQRGFKGHGTRQFPIEVDL